MKVRRRTLSKQSAENRNNQFAISSEKQEVAVRSNHKPKHGNTMGRSTSVVSILAVGAAANLGPHLGAVSFTFLLHSSSMW